MVGNIPAPNGPASGQPGVNSPAVLWALLKAQTRALMSMRAENVALGMTVWSLSTEATNRTLDATLDALITVCLDNARLASERDEIARESTVREQEIIALTVERDKLETRLSELDTSGEGGVA